MNMLSKFLLLAASVLVAYCIFLILHAIKRRCSKPPADVEDAPLTGSLLAKDLPFGETLKRGFKKESRIEPTLSREAPTIPGFSLPVSDISLEDTSISLEVISGPSTGIRISRKLHQDSGISLSIGRISQNDIVLSDSEVSGKHALISWNSEVSRWELVDMGSLNGTLVNSKCVSAGRRRSTPVGLTSGDILTLGSTSQVLVRISNSRFSVSSAPFDVGVSADAMSLRREKLVMEDVCFCEWPLRGLQQFGVFCIFDGHGGVGAAEAASRIIPQKLSDSLADEREKNHVLMECDASKILRHVFKEVEENLNCEYEGCTATVILVWSRAHEFFIQCANVGDSACILSTGGKQVVLTEDHRLTSPSERKRLLDMGKVLKDGETRLCGMNIARALGDKFLKQEEKCFSTEPYVSQAVKLTHDSKGMLVVASDGLWDVFSPMRAMQLALECRDGKSSDNVPPRSAEGIAQILVHNARLLKTKDNTTVIVLDFWGGTSSNKPSFCTL